MQAAVARLEDDVAAKIRDVRIAGRQCHRRLPFEPEWQSGEWRAVGIPQVRADVEILARAQRVNAKLTVEVAHADIPHEVWVEHIRPHPRSVAVIAHVKPIAVEN